MKNLMRFSDAALTKSEMKAIKGGGCGSSCYWPGGWSEQSANYGNSTKAQAKEMALSCAQAGGKGYWCCASC